MESRETCAPGNRHEGIRWEMHFTFWEAAWAISALVASWSKNARPWESPRQSGTFRTRSAGADSQRLALSNVFQRLAAQTCD
jgi:hypothetical protein